MPESRAGAPGRARLIRWAVPVSLGAVLLTVAAPASARTHSAPPELALVSVSTSGDHANGPSERPTISLDGRYVAFTSYASNLVADDTNDTTDVFVRDLRAGRTQRVSVASDGSQANGGSAIDPQINGSGRYVAFVSEATNLVAGDTNGANDVFLRDLKTGRTERVSVASGGGQSNANSSKPTVSRDGRFVAFTSAASNLVAGDTNDTWDSFVYDRWTRQTERLSVSTSGTQTDEMSDGPVLSPDGRYAMFISLATNLVAGDTNAMGDVFLRDRWLRRTTRISVGSHGEQGDDLSVGAQISADNRYVAFASHATTLTPDSPDTHDSHAFVRDLVKGTTTMVDTNADGAVAEGGSFWTAISADGRYYTYISAGGNIVDGDTNGLRDIFRRELRGGETIRISTPGNGVETTMPSFYPVSSSNGKIIAFMSYAEDMVAQDGNDAADVFVWRTR